MIGKTLDKISRNLLCLILFSMLALSLAMIGLRWAGSSPLWIDPLIRHLVLVTAFVGGSLAVGRNTHLRIDVFAKLLESAAPWLRLGSLVIVNLVTLIVSAALCYSGWQFFLSEREFGNQGLLGFHSSWWVAILPLGWGWLSLRWFVLLIEQMMEKRNA